jgi:hypothetical protein
LIRYRFFQPTDDAETGLYLRQMNSIGEFWQRFRQVSGRRASTWAVELRALLETSVPGLGLEVRESANGVRRLYIVPVAGAEYTPLARAFVERAPEIPGWEFGVEREPQELIASLGATYKDQGVDLSHARARVGVGRGHGLEVVLASEHFRSLDADADLDAAHQLLNHLLGDQLMNHWVCNVSTVAQPKPSPLRLLGAEHQRLPLSLAELMPSVEAAVRGIDQGLPEHPCHTHCEQAEWVMFECEQGNPSASAEPASDLLMACTMRPEMLKWHLQGGEFSSRRFSRCGEHFCYLKLEGGPDVAEDAERRVQLEEQLDRWLVPGRLGCVVGGGPGRNHQYVLLALTELDHAITLLGRQLSQVLGASKASGGGGFGGKSWMLFCDSEWRQEWVGFGHSGPPTRSALG